MESSNFFAGEHVEQIGAVVPRYDAPPTGLSDLSKGLILAISSSLFIGSSFIIKKKGLRIAGTGGLRAGAGGFGYLREPVWWMGMLAMVFGELANFAAYAFAPAILVTPLGALSILVSAVLAHYLLKEKLNVFGVVGCILCCVGSFVIVIHAPEERQLDTIKQVATLALQPSFCIYAAMAIAAVCYLVFVVAPEWGSSNLLVYIGICSLMGSLSVMSCKGLGIALKLTFQGSNQFLYPETYFCILVVAVCVTTQLNYLNKALDIFNTAIVSPVYYVMFTVLTIIASMIMFQDQQQSHEVAAEISGFITIVSGVFLLHTTKDMDIGVAELAAVTMKPTLREDQPFKSETPWSSRSSAPGGATEVSTLLEPGGLLRGKRALAVEHP